MKRISILFVVAVAAATAYFSYPEEFKHYLNLALGCIAWAWESVQANPGPVALAAGTFLLTVVYHKAKGKSLRESVEVAATRVAVVPIPMSDSLEENLVLKRAKARAMRSQLLADQNGLENRHRKLPDEIRKAEKDACYTEQAVAEAAKNLTERQKVHDEAAVKLEALRREKALADAELAEIESELKRLAEVV
jgi:hypothetical protein